MNDKFTMEEVENTFTRYNINKIVDGVVLQKRDDGVIFNIGGKSDAFIKNNDFENFQNVKVGDRFKAQIVKLKNEEGMIECSKSLADKQLQDNCTAEGLKLGSVFTVYITSFSSQGISSKIGEYEIFIPSNETLNSYNLKRYVGKQIRIVVTELNKAKKQIIASEKIIFDQEKQMNESNFWKSSFINKVVDGTVESIVPYGAFVNVGGVRCLAHISDLSYDKIDKVTDVLNIGDSRQFRIIKIDRDANKVNLGIKQLSDNPKLLLIKQTNIGDILNGKVIKILEFGAIIECENGITGLLHISQATNENNRNIYEIVKLGDSVKVEIIKLDIDKQRVSFRLI